MGKLLAKILLAINLSWLLADFIIWQLGKQTMSQWVILTATESPLVAISWIAIVLAVPAILIWHWELIPILTKHIKRAYHGKKEKRD